MQRIPKIIRKDSLMKEHNYAVFYEQGLIVFNGIFGVRYAFSRLDSHIQELITKWESFAVYDAVAMQKALKLLGNVKELKVVETDSGHNLVFTFKGGKGKLALAMTLDISSNLEHFLIDWPEYSADEPDPELELEYGRIPVDSSWEDFKNLITKDGESQWPNSYGIYGDEGKLKSFDSLAYIEATTENGMDFFCPQSVISLGLSDIEYALPGAFGLFLVGKDITYYTARALKNTAIVDNSAVARLFDDEANFETYEIEIDKSAQTWARAKEFVAGNRLVFSVKEGKIIISNEKWEEEIGVAEGMQNITFTMPLNLIERWVQHTIGHEISKVENNWYVRGRTLRGFIFVARLSSSSSYEGGHYIEPDTVDIDPNTDLI